MRRLLLALLVLCTLLPAASAQAADPEDRIVLSGPVLVDRGETVGDVAVIDGDVTIRGTVRGDILVADGDVAIRGRVRGDVVTLGGRATLGRRARVGGDIVYFDKKPVISKGARLDGETKKYDGGEIAGVGGGLAIGFWLAVTLSALVLGLLLLLVAPRAADAAAKAPKGIAIGVGIGAFILLPVIAVVACISILGLPFGIGLLLALFPLYAIGYVTAAFAIGRLIIKGARIPAFIVGLLILRALALIPIAGGLIGLLATIFGLGVLLTALFRARSA